MGWSDLGRERVWGQGVPSGVPDLIMAPVLVFNTDIPVQDGLDWNCPNMGDLITIWWYGLRSSHLKESLKSP